MKRQRGRGRGGKPGGGHHHNHHQNPNRSMESNGPEGAKVRGPAAVVYERYLQLARDAASSGDRVLSENFSQHADHYFRLLRAMQPAMPVQTQADRFANEFDEESEEDGAPEGEAVEAGGEEEHVEGEAGAQQQARREPQGDGQQGDRGFERDGDFRRRRGRRNRFRPEGGEIAQGEGGEPRSERPPRESREGGEPRAERREPREARENRDQSGPEGFSTGPKPAFLRSE